MLLAVDGNSLLHRAYHSGGGQDGFISLLVSALSRLGSVELLVGFDDPRSSLRRVELPAYKAGRAAKEPALEDLLDRVPAFLRGIGVAVAIPAGLEADDVLGAAAARASAAAPVTLLTSDRDAIALVGPHCSLFKLESSVSRAPILTPALVRDLYGVDPASYLMLAVLRGDPSDDLPGCPGAGAKTAAALAAEFHNLDDLFAAAGAGTLTAPRKVLAALVDPDVQEGLRQGWAISSFRPVDLPGVAEFTAASLRAAAARQGEDAPVSPALAPDALPPARRADGLVPTADMDFSAAIVLDRAPIVRALEVYAHQSLSTPPSASLPPPPAQLGADPRPEPQAPAVFELPAYPPRIRPERSLLADATPPA